MRALSVRVSPETVEITPGVRWSEEGGVPGIPLGVGRGNIPNLFVPFASAQEARPQMSPDGSAIEDAMLQQIGPTNLRARIAGYVVARDSLDPPWPDGPGSSTW